MPEEEAPIGGANEEAALEPEAPAEATDDPQVDYQKRYEDARQELDRRGSVLDKFKQYGEPDEIASFLERQQDPEFRREQFNKMADEFGYALPDQQEEYVDPGELALQEAQAIRAEMEQQREAQQEDAFWQEKSEGFIEALDDFQEQNFKLTDAEVKAAGAQVLLAGANPEDVFEDLQAIRQAGYEHIVESKKAPRIATGQAGTPKFDPTNEKEVDAALLAEVEAAMADSDD